MCDDLKRARDREVIMGLAVTALALYSFVRMEVHSPDRWLNWFIPLVLWLAVVLSGARTMV